MSTWQLFSDEGSTFRWEISEELLPNQEAAEPNGALAQQPSQPHHLPSMADLLLQGCSRMEVRDGNLDGIPTFRTGLGKSVAVKQSSVSRALAILHDEGEEAMNKGCSRLINEVPRCKLNDALNFQTGLGMSVGVRQSSITRALGILSDEGDQVICTGQQSEEENGLGFPNTTSWFDPPKALQISKSTCWTGREKTNNTPNSLFQTASGKMVGISSEGLLRAKTLLGSEENGDHKNFEDLEKKRKQSASYKPFGVESLFPLEVEEGGTNIPLNNATFFEMCPLDNEFNSLRCQSTEVIPDIVQTASKTPPVKFQTAGGRSISVSSDALQRAKSLLGNQEVGAYSNEGTATDHVFSFLEDRDSGKTNSNEENGQNTPIFFQPRTHAKSLPNTFTSPFRSNSCQKEFSVRLSNIGQGSNLIKKFDAEANDSANGHHNSLLSYENPSNKKAHASMQDLSENGFTLKSNSSERPPRGPLLDSSEMAPRGPLVDVSNRNVMELRDVKWNSGEKRRMGSTVSPFKRPRSSKFVTPLSKRSSSICKGLSALTRKETTYKGRVSTRYPFQTARLYIKEYIGEPPSYKSKIENLPDQIRRMNPDAAKNYMFDDGFGSDRIGAETFYHMLIQSGASPLYVSKEWVANHYKWIVWKLASFERCYPARFSGKLLSVSNVLEELKYRYEKEVNHGHRSTIKRILEGDAPPSTRMVLCISSICSNRDSEIDCQTVSSMGSERGAAAKIELTDGWYSVIALLDALLSKKLAARKIFVGQKLTIWGAGLCGWAGPFSPLEASKTSCLMLHINGTYRAHWADRLGFCKFNGLPLAFRSIKSAGGAVPSTLVGILRTYPVLYRERLSDGGVIVRSEKMQAKMLQLYNQKRSVLVEGVMSEFQRENKEFESVDDDCEEGAKLLKILEKAAEPEVLMAEMTSEQLTSFASYKAKLEAAKQSNMQISLEKALEAAGLSGREVTPFMRVRVVGLTSKSSTKKCSPQMGLITIWNPTEKQQLELVEGRAYAVSWLVPSNSDSSTLYLQTKGSSTKWLCLSPSATEYFQPFFSPRKSITLSNLGEVSLSSEFDIAAYVVYVGDAYATARHKKQWVFVTDGSIHELYSREPLESLLAISFSAPSSESDLFAPVNSNLAGSTVGLCNLIKRAKDQLNNVWVAEATESSTYSLTFDHVYFSHLKDAAVSTQKWANISNMKIETLKQRVLSIISNSNAQILKEL